jgi:hypothetical protein
MEAKSEKKSKKDFYAEPINKEIPKYVMYHGHRFSILGQGAMEVGSFKFEEGIVYPVSDEVYEMVKHIIGFYEIKAINERKVEIK